MPLPPGSPDKNPGGYNAHQNIVIDRTSERLVFWPLESHHEKVDTIIESLGHCDILQGRFFQHPPFGLRKSYHIRRTFYLRPQWHLHRNSRVRFPRLVVIPPMVLKRTC